MPDWNTIFAAGKHIDHDPDGELLRVLPMIQSAGAKRILGFGCGAGRHVVHLAREGFDVVGADITVAGIAHARRWLADEHLSAELVELDRFDALPLPNASVDAVISTNAIHHGFIADIAAELHELARVTRPGGYFFATVHLDAEHFITRGFTPTDEPGTYMPPADDIEAGVPHHNFRDAELRQMWHDSGFEVIELAPFTPPWLTTDEKTHFAVLTRRIVHHASHS